MIPFDWVITVWGIGVGWFWLTCARRAHRDIVVGVQGRKATPADFVASVTLGFCLAIFWPLFIPGWLIYVRLKKEETRG